MMTRKLMLPAGLLLCSVAAHAQAGPTSLKSAEDITCELTGDCEAVDSSLANKDAGQSRGFSIRRQNGSPTTTNAPRPANVISSRSSRNNRSAASATRYVQRPAVTSASVGRSNLAVGFLLGSSDLDASGRAQAGKLLEALRGPKLAGKTVIVAGHTDSIGARAYNLDLSRRRADALVDFLAQNGVDRSRLDARGYGFDRPLPGTSARAAANRRVEISVAN